MNAGLTFVEEAPLSHCADPLQVGLLVHLVCPFFFVPLWENQCHGLLTRGYEVHGVPHYSACGGLFVLAAESFAVLTQGHAPTHWGEKK